MRSEPYPWPYDRGPGEAIDARRLAVVVAGWQPFWLERVAGPVDLGVVLRAVDDLRAAGSVVLWVRHGAPGGSRRRPTHLPTVGSSGWELLSVPAEADVVVDTPGFDAFLVEWTDLELRRRGRDRLVMAGLGTEGPVSATTRSANDRGYECLTATDLVAHHDPLTGAAQLSSTCMSGGIFGAVGRAADLLAELVPDPTLHLRPL